MAVFTTVSFDQATAWLAGFDLGRLRSIEGISTGIENSNFFVDTEHGRFVLTLFERVPATELPFYLGLMRHLSRHGIRCPEPIADRRGSLYGELNDRPAAIVTCLPGRALSDPDAADCAQVGEMLARMHQAAADFQGSRPNPRGLRWCVEAAARLRGFLDSARRKLLDDEIDAQQGFAGGDASRALRRTAVHCDLFRDNVLFDGDRLGGVIDFYFAGVDAWLYDLAVTCNDWCIDDASGELDAGRTRALLDGYGRVQPPSVADLVAWPMMLRAAALRFWVSRLYDRHLPRPAQQVVPKDPGEFERILRARRAGVIGWVNEPRALNG